MLFLLNSVICLATPTLGVSALKSSNPVVMHRVYTLIAMLMFCFSLLAYMYCCMAYILKQYCYKLLDIGQVFCKKVSGLLTIYGAPSVCK